ncbi:uncharacterized protein LOC133544253 isoform X2 [Nerophis ophidion]|uniref:uncharacterized protein LOC133544253 isoform X2 n=1 Tax=Nerophis ophidion TaxID=159077 RepID=UPI002AE03960|nr:uncharacterized protein LOC133544253 isoform X2 [Nerophis ophidion]
MRTLLLLLGAVSCSHFHLVQSLSGNVTFPLTQCSLNFYGGSFPIMNVELAADTMNYCFSDNFANPECISISSGILADSVDTVVTNASDPTLETSVRSQLPQLEGNMTCYINSTLSLNGSVNMVVTLMKFGSQTALSVFKPTSLETLHIIAKPGFETVETDLTYTEEEKTKYMDLSGCRLMDTLLFPSSNSTNPMNCVTYTCSPAAEISDKANCGTTEICQGNNKCNPKFRLCTVTGNQVVAFFGNVSSIPGLCVYSLLKPVVNASFELLGAFQERRIESLPLLDRLDLVFLQSNLTISIGTSRSVRVNGEILTLPASVEGVMLTRDVKGVTVNISKGSISDDPVSIVFDGYSAYIKVPSEALFQGSCGHTGDPSYSSLPLAQSDLSCTPPPNSVANDVNTAATDQCSLLMTKPFADCHLKEPVEPVRQACVSFLSKYPLMDHLDCQFFEVYALACELQFQISLGDWRSSIRCPDPQAYCQDHDCIEHEFCGDSLVNGTGCHCRAAFAANYMSDNVFGQQTECNESLASFSLIGCLLEDKGIDYTMLHLNNDACRGEKDSKTHLVTFNFNSSGTCGTVIKKNNSQLLFKNSLSLGQPLNGSIITRQRVLELDLSCVYPEPEQSFVVFNIKSSPMVQEVVSKNWNYTLFMKAYTDPGRRVMLTENMEVELNQQVWIELSTEGLRGEFVKLVTDSCWATNDSLPTANLRYDLISDGCPNLSDGTVEIVGNGLGTENYFSFRMFQFLNSSNFYLHCAVSLCVDADCTPTCSQPSGRRRRALQRTRDGQRNNYESGGVISVGWST